MRVLDALAALRVPARNINDLARAIVRVDPCDAHMLAWSAAKVTLRTGFEYPNPYRLGTKERAVWAERYRAGLEFYRAERERKRAFREKFAKARLA